MTTWIVGDIHGCAEELSRLLERLALGPDDDLVAAGDLFHRGPDAAGVARLLCAARARFVLGNHELRVLRRLGLAPTSTDPADRPPRRDDWPELSDEDLRGDGGARCALDPKERVSIVRFLQGHAGFLVSSARESRPPARDGSPWVVVHAGIDPRRPLSEQRIADLVSTRRLPGPGRPFWYEAWEGPELVLFGHTPSPAPRPHRYRGRLVALGLDTGCVYGGRLSAYAPELDELVSVAASRDWVHA